MTQSWKWWHIALAALIGGVLIVGVLSSGRGSKTSQGDAQPFTSSDAPPASVRARASVHVDLSMHGSGNKTTQRFDAPDPMRIQWSYDCRNAYGSGALSVALVAPGDELSGGGQLGLPVNEFGAGGAGESFTHHYGLVWLDITATCPWTLRVSG